MSEQSIENSESHQLSKLLMLYFALFIFARVLVFRIVISDIPIFIILFLEIYHVAVDRAVRVNRLDAVFLSFIGISMVGMNVTNFPATYFQEIVIVVFLYISARMISMELSSFDKIKSALNILSNSVFILILFLSVIVLARQLEINFFVDWILPEGDRLSWPFVFPNQLGIALTVLFPVTMLSCEKFWKRCIVYFAMILVVGAVGSRASFAILCAEIFFLELIFLEELFTMQFIVKGVVLFIIFSGLLMLTSESYVFRRSTGQIKKTPMFYDRSRITTITEAFSLPNSFILGNGLGCFKKSHKYEIHNTPISLFIETGLFGFIIALYVFYLIIQPVMIAWRSENRLIKLLMVAVFAIIFQSMVTNLIRTRAVWLIIALCMSLPTALKKVSQESSSSI